MIGKVLGHYQITNQLRKGGMGEVFQAQGPEASQFSLKQIAGRRSV